MRTPDAKHDALNRLSYIEGHLRGIRKMIEDDQCCIDVLKQSFAVRCAIQKFEEVLLRNHLDTRFPEDLREGPKGEIVNELEGSFG